MHPRVHIPAKQTQILSLSLLSPPVALSPLSISLAHSLALSHAHLLSVARELSLCLTLGSLPSSPFPLSYSSLSPQGQWEVTDDEPLVDTHQDFVLRSCQLVVVHPASEDSPLARDFWAPSILNKQNEALGIRIQSESDAPDVRP